MKLEEILQILPEFTRWYFEFLLRVGHWSKTVPFHVTKKVTHYRKVQSFTKRYQWLQYHLIWSGFIGLTLYHFYAGYQYTKVNGINTSTAIYSIFILIYLTASIFTLSMVFCAWEAIALLNSSSGSQFQGLLAGIRWEEDLFLQFFAVQMCQGSIIVQCVCCLVLPWLYPDAPWMLVSHLQWLLKHFPLAVRIIAIIIIEFVNITLPTYTCLSAVSVFMVSFTVMKIGLRRLKYVAKGTFAQALQAGREMEIYDRVCNNWWRAFFIPGNGFVCFIYMLFPLYFTLTKYDSDLPVYIYAMYPMLFMITLVGSAVVYSEMAYIHILSFHIVKDLCVKSHDGRPRFHSIDNDYILPSRTNKVLKSTKYHLVSILALSKRRRLFALRPIRVEVGTFGHYIKLSAVAKLVSEVFTYLLLMLRLRELNVSELT